MCAPSTHRITITNFCLGKHLVSEDDLLKDQRGSPAYISPDVLSGERKEAEFHVFQALCHVIVTFGSPTGLFLSVPSLWSLQLDFCISCMWCKDVPCKMWSRLDHYILLEEQSSCQTNLSVGIVTYVSKY